MKATLKGLRANAGMTQKEAAKAVGISVETWRNYEIGKTYPDVLILKKIENAFKVKYSDIIFFT